VRRYIAAHPDDELFGAGYLAKLVAEDKANAALPRRVLDL